MIEKDGHRNLIEEIRDNHKEHGDSDIVDSDEISKVEGISQFILCRCGDVSVSFLIEDVRELVAFGELNVSLLPSLSPPSIGIIRRKGDLIPLASLAAVLDSGNGHVSKTTGRAVICNTEVNGRIHSFGVLVDEVLAVVAVENSSLSLISQKLAGSPSMAFDLLKKIFCYEGNDYRVIDTGSLYRFLTGTIKRRKVA